MVYSDSVDLKNQIFHCLSQIGHVGIFKVRKKSKLTLKLHKPDNFVGSDFEIFTFPSSTEVLVRPFHLYWV